MVPSLGERASRTVENCLGFASLRRRGDGLSPTGSGRAGAPPRPRGARTVDLVDRRRHPPRPGGNAASPGGPPEGSAERMATELGDLAKELGARRLVIAGDVKHPIVGTPPPLRPVVFGFFSSLLARGVRVELVLGNHDVGLVPYLPREVRVHSAEGAVRDSVGIFHGHCWPERRVLRAPMLVTGHLHPGFRFAPTPDQPSGKRRCWVRVQFAPGALDLSREGGEPAARRAAPRADRSPGVQSPGRDRVPQPGTPPSGPVVPVPAVPGPRRCAGVPARRDGRRAARYGPAARRFEPSRVASSAGSVTGGSHVLPKQTSARGEAPGEPASPGNENGGGGRPRNTESRGRLE